MSANEIIRVSGLKKYYKGDKIKASMFVSLEFKGIARNADGTVNTEYNEKNGDDQFVNGVVQFKLKDREQKMFWTASKFLNWAATKLHL